MKFVSYSLKCGDDHLNRRSKGRPAFLLASFCSFLLLVCLLLESVVVVKEEVVDG